MTTIPPTSPVRLVKTPAAAPRIAQAARAQGGDPLPSFPDARAYQNYVINLVAQSRQLEREIETAGKIAGADKPNDPIVMALRERLDATKLQLKILRDDFPIPASWTRWKLAGGEGFDKDEFWRSQVEAIPGKAVVVTPEPPKPAPQPAAPTPANLPAPAPLPTIALDNEPADPRVGQLLRLALAAHKGGLTSSASDGFAKATQACPTAADAMAVFLTAHSKGYSNAATSAAVRAIALAGDSATSLSIALAAHSKGYSNAATSAFSQATRQAPTQAVALQVALAAHAKGYSNAASDAFHRAIALSTTSAEALQTGENATKKGYSRAAQAAMTRAMDLP